MYQGALKPTGDNLLETGKKKIFLVYGEYIKGYGEGISTCLWVKIQRNLFSGRIWRSTKHKMVNFVLQVWSEAAFSYFLTQYFFQKCAATLKRQKFVSSITACMGNRRQKWAKSLAVTTFTIDKPIQIILSSSCRQ